MRYICCGWVYLSLKLEVSAPCVCFCACVLVLLRTLTSRYVYQRNVDYRYLTRKQQRRTSAWHCYRCICPGHTLCEFFKCKWPVVISLLEISAEWNEVLATTAGHGSLYTDGVIRIDRMDGSASAQTQHEGTVMHFHDFVIFSNSEQKHGLCGKELNGQNRSFWHPFYISLVYHRCSVPWWCMLVVLTAIKNTFYRTSQPEKEKEKPLEVQLDSPKIPLEQMEPIGNANSECNWF